MGDETHNDSRATTRPKPTSTASLRPAKFWKGMIEFFGQRWAESFGAEPSPLWVQAIESLTDAQLKDGIARVMKSGAQHPPTMPDFLVLARGIARTVEWKPEPSKCSDAQKLATQWFMHRSVRHRFVGMDANRDYAGFEHPLHTELAFEVLRLAEGHLLLVSEKDPQATKERFERLADAEAERIYPRALAIAWLAEHGLH